MGRPNLQSAKDRLMNVNPLVQIDAYETTLRSDTALELFEDYDAIIDGADNFPTRYMTSDTSFLLGKPNV
jgi:molybdopterin/thiamine biosynthesis adenylyltransferase